MKSDLNFRFAVFATMLFIGIHGLDYTDLEATKVSCPHYDSCAERSSYSFEPRSCECDSKCVSYNDCCIDSKYSEVKWLNSSKFICMPEVKTYTYGVYAMSTCQQNWQGPDEIKSKCEVFDDLSDPLMSTPATDKQQNVTYRSRYCAECNNAVPDELTYWGISTYCRTSSGKFVRDTFDDLIYRPDLNEWGFSKDNIYYTCDILFDEPRYIVSYVRDCRVNLIGTCPNSWSRMEVKVLCEAYMAMVVYEDKFYRNPHCALCNGINFDKVECSYISSGRGEASVAILFDANRSDGDIVGERSPKKPSCPKGQNYDPFFKKCRELSCGLPGLKMVDGNCVNT